MGECPLSLTEQVEDMFSLYGREFAQCDRELATFIRASVFAESDRELKDLFNLSGPKNLPLVCGLVYNFEF